MAELVHRPRRLLITNYKQGFIPKNADCFLITENYLICTPPDEWLLRWEQRSQGAVFISTRHPQKGLCRRHSEVPNGIITQEQYIRLITTRLDRRLQRIEKTCYTFSYRNKHFTVYVYQGRLRGLYLLEMLHEDFLDLTDAPFGWDLVEVGDDARYSDRTLARQVPW